MINEWLILVYVALVIISLILLTVIIYYSVKLMGCERVSNFSCWSDWTCPAGSAVEKPAQALYSCNQNKDYCQNNPQEVQCLCRANDGVSSCQCGWQSTTSCFVKTCNLKLSDGPIGQCQN